MKTAARIEGFSRVQVTEYPVEALREAVINALVHRDYEIAGSTVMIQIFSNRIVVASPGKGPQYCHPPRRRRCFWGTSLGMR